MKRLALKELDILVATELLDQTFATLVMTNSELRQFTSFNSWDKSWQDLVKLGFNERFKRMWEFYLAYCETGFISKSTDVSHFIINK